MFLFMTHGILGTGARRGPGGRRGHGAGDPPGDLPGAGDLHGVHPGVGDPRGARRGAGVVRLWPTGVLTATVL